MKTKSRKILKVFGIIVLVLAIAVSAIAVWQWKNIKVLYTAMTQSTEKIKERREENNKKLIEKVNSYLDEELREPTKEEKELIKSGELQLPELYADIISERYDEVITYNEEKDIFESVPKKDVATSNEPVPKNDDTIPKEERPKEETKEKERSKSDEIVSKYVCQLYVLQDVYTGKSEALIAQGASYYNDLAKTQDRAAARTNTISHFSQNVRGLEADCDAKVEEIISNLNSELKELDADLSIIDTIRETYELEKQLKMSYYASKYL